MERKLDLSHGPSATEAAGQAVPTRAHVVHAAAALYLGIGSRKLRGVLDVGVSACATQTYRGIGPSWGVARSDRSSITSSR
jgi:hypothetical protein